MTTKSSIFEAVPESPPDAAAEKSSPSPKNSPFRVPDETADSPEPGNAESKPTKLSPFVVIDDANPPPPSKPRPAKIPEKRKPRSPFQIAEEGDAVGMMPAAQGFPASSPFHPTHAGYPAPPVAYPPMPVDPAYGAYPVYPAAYPPPPMAHGLPIDPLGSRQIELRAIFGVDRPMSMEEILQHCRNLPGVRDLTFLSGREATAIDSLNYVLQRLGMASSPLRVQAGETPLELVREGPVILAVLPDGEFQAGVRETLTIVAREIARMM